MSYADFFIASGTGVLGAISAVPAVAGSFTVTNNRIQAAVAAVPPPGPPAPQGAIQSTVVIVSRTAPFAATTAVAIVATVTAGTVLFEARDAANAVVAADVGGFSYLILNNNSGSPYSG